MILKDKKRGVTTREDQDENPRSILSLNEHVIVLFISLFLYSSSCSFIECCSIANSRLICFNFLFMSLANSPRKQVPLATGDEIRPRDFVSTPSTTKRVFFCGVVVEGSENGKELSDGT